MILQALTNYYDRAQLSPPGWELKAIPFFIVLTKDGQVINVSSRIDKENPRGSQILVPQSEIRSGKNAWAQPNLLWDHYGFVLGEPKRKPNGTIDPTDSFEKANKQLSAFIARIESLYFKYPESKGLAAISKFYANGEYKKVFSRTDSTEMVKIAGANMTFRLVDEVEPILQEKWVQDICAQNTTADEGNDVVAAPKSAMCLVTGNFEEIARLHPKIYNVCSKPAALAAANSKEAQAYSSYRKDQGFIFPVGKPAAFAYTTALNHLLRKDSPQRIQVGDASTVFWADQDSEFESLGADVFGEPDKDKPDGGAPAIKALFQAVHSGKFAEPDDNRFHILGLAPNAARISIRFYHCLPLPEMARRITQHFTDLEMVRGPYDPEYPSLFRLLTAVALQNKADNIPPNLGGAVVDAIFAGPDVPYPALWLNAAVGRCRAEQNVTYLRAAAIKACINRQIRRQIQSAAISNQSAPTSTRLPNPPEKEFLPMLDLDNTNPAYRLGRLFATLERIQEEASEGKLNSTIRDRYYGAASSTPASVFPTLLRLKVHHLGKLHPGRVTTMEKLLGEIMSSFQPDSFPPRQLSLPDQGRFALGYYHQRQTFFSKPTDSNTPAKEGTPS